MSSCTSPGSMPSPPAVASNPPARRLPIDASRLAPLTHPGWWLALTVLVVNDHWLKGSGMIPAAVAGKLSDFAGLLVAPVLVAAIVGARSIAARWVAFIACAVPFSAINLRPEWATIWDQWWGWRTVCDPSDLMALVVAPLAVRMAGAHEMPVTLSATPWRAFRPALAHLGAAMGALACLATSPVEPEWTTRGGPLFQNVTDETITLRVRYIDARIDCDAFWGEDAIDAAQALDPSLFDLGITYRVEPGEAADLTRPSDLEPTPARAIDDRACDALLLNVDGIGDQLIVGGGGTFHTLQRAGDGTLELTGPSLEPVRVPEPSDCPAIDAPRFEWSGGATHYSRIVAVEDLSQGCFRVDLVERPATRDDARPANPFEVVTDPDAEPIDAPHVDEELLHPELDPRMLDPEVHTLFICAPRELFAMVVGDDVTVGMQSGALTVETAAQGFSLRSITTTRARDSRLCVGRRDACGGYSAPLSHRMGSELLLSGDRLSYHARQDDGSVRDLTLAVGRLEHVVVSSEACGSPRLGAQGFIASQWETAE